MLLNSVELGVLEECLRVFRGSLFATDPREARANTLEYIGEQISAALQEALAAEQEEGASQRMQQLVTSYGGDIAKMSEDLHHAMQIVLEFMDKGMKGMLTGDLSSFAVKTIQTTIEKQLPRMEELQMQIEQLDEAHDASEAIDREFKIGTN
jgi:hypothetical protein